LNTTSSQLAEIQKVYPGKNFPDVTTLRNWISSQTLPANTNYADVSYRNALALQAKAAKDGYLISAVIFSSTTQGYYWVYCYAALSDGSLWYWSPESYNVTYWLNVNNF